jgi:diguanylate cyclase (GGDEF)-like protein
VATIRSILECITNVKMENARFANPLTGLPGNLQIQHEIQNKLFAKNPFSVIYVDLDDFKSFNDLYGYQKGDQFIQYTSEVLKKVVLNIRISLDFVGHIGGDDFIVISTIDQPERLCQDIISEFEKGISRIYNKQQWSSAIGRDGLPLQTEGPTISLSLIICTPNSEMNSEMISVLAAKAKKAAKSQLGNIYNVNTIS